jgi:hypothetical protein
VSARVRFSCFYDVMFAELNIRNVMPESYLLCKVIGRLVNGLYLVTRWFDLLYYLN